VSPSLILFLDLGDVFTKGLCIGHTRREWLLFPSIVAHELLRGGPEMAKLVLDEHASLPRLSDFDAQKYPRTRSFRGSDDFVRLVQERPPTMGARFAGGIAAVYGADRQLLGMHPTSDNVEALVRKAFLLSVENENAGVEVVFVVDIGPKADTITRYSESGPRRMHLEVHNYRHVTPRALKLELRTRTVDAMACAHAALPSELASERVIIIDIGYLRTKFAILSEHGAEHQEQADLGVSDCVYRILRDGQDHGLVEDEFAVIVALEKSPPERFEVAGRHFDVRQTLDSACRALQEEVLRAARRIVLAHYRRSAQTCAAAAIIGGGAALVGAALADRLKRELGIDASWVSENDPSLLVKGARSISLRAQ
jgi:hypothetical protein